MTPKMPPKSLAAPNLFLAGIRGAEQRPVRCRAAVAALFVSRQVFRSAIRVATISPTNHERELSPGIGGCCQKCRPGLWPRQALSRRNFRSRAETGSNVSRDPFEAGGMRSDTARRGCCRPDRHNPRLSRRARPPLAGPPERSNCESTRPFMVPSPRCRFDAHDTRTVRCPYQG